MDNDLWLDDLEEPADEDENRLDFRYALQDVKAALESAMEEANLMEDSVSENKLETMFEEVNRMLSLEFIGGYDD